MSVSNMQNNMVELGDYIELCDEINDKGRYSIKDAMGMTITKEIIPTKADLSSSNLSNFWVVKPNEFVYNPRTHGKKIGLGYNNKGKSIIISWNNVAFKVKDNTLLNPDYLYIIISREEWDRNACFRSWGSSTEVFSWTEFCRTQIPLPDIDTQQELVDTYNGLKGLAEQNEALIKPLTEACQAYIVDCKTKYPEVELGEYIEELDERNMNNAYTLEDVKGISTEKKFIATKANLNGVSLTKYKVVHNYEFAYVADTSRRGDKIALALNSTSKSLLISSIYTTFRSIDSEELLSEYIYLLLRRKEFDRYSRFNSWGSARETFDWRDLCRVRIPLPPPEVQQAIVNIYNCAEEAKKIANEAREKMKTLCPALVQKAING